MKKLFLFFIALLVLQTNVIADEKSGIIHGYVTDRTSGLPLIGANVYLANTTIGSSSNRNGYFIIDKIPYGVYDLIISYIGYDQKFIRLTITDKRLVHKVDAKLDQQNMSLDEIVVTDTVSQSYINMFARFKDEFFGRSQNANGIRLYNPEVINLEISGRGVLSANTSKELHIANNSLGYDLKLYINRFSLDGNILEFDNKPFYIDRIAEIPDPMEVTQRRTEAYIGSRRHFIRSLAKNELHEDGFRIYDVTDIDESKLGFYSQEIEDVSMIMNPKSDYERTINFDNFLKIVYYNELESEEFMKYRMENLQSYTILTDVGRQKLMEPGYQTSWIKLNKSDVKIDTSGTVYDYNGIVFYGYMTYERMADLLPVNYEFIPFAPEYYSNLNFQKSWTENQKSRILTLKNLEKTSTYDWKLCNEIGNLYLSLDHFDSSRTWFSKSLSIDPEQEETYIGMGYAYLYQGNNYSNPFTGFVEKLSDSDNISRAESTFKEVLKLNPLSINGTLALSDRFIHSGKKSLLNQAKNRLLALSDTTSSPVRYRLGQIAYKLNEPEKAESYFRDALSADSLNGNAMIYLSRLNALKEQYEKASSLYLAGLQTIDDWMLIDEIARYSEPILPPDFFVLAEGSRTEKMIKLARFWLRNTTIGVDNVNEFLITYLKRVEYVRQNYRMANTRLYDDRGEIFLKFGPPNSKFTDPIPPKGHANESWIYDSISGREISFDFVSTGGNYRLVPNLSYALPAGDRGQFLAGNTGSDITPYTAVIGNMYSARSHISPSYQRVANSFAEARGIFKDREVIRSFFNQFNSYTTSQAAVQSAVKEESNIRTEETAENIIISFYRFRGFNQRVRLNMNFAFNPMIFNGIKEENRANLNKNITVLDAAGKTILTANRPFTYSGINNSLDSSDPEDETFIVGSDLFDLYPGEYLFKVKIHDNEKVYGYGSKWTELEPFNNKKLSVSDVFIMPDENYKMIIGDRINWPEVRPNPLSLVTQENPMGVYFEIYNVRDMLMEEANYEIEYKILRPEGDESSFKKLLNRLTFSNRSKYAVSQNQKRRTTELDSNEYILIDTKNLKPGSAVLEIVVTDRNSLEKKLIRKEIVVVKK